MATTESGSGAIAETYGETYELTGAIAAEESARPKLTVVEDRRPPHIKRATELLLGTLDESAAWYTEVATMLNDGRDEDEQFEIVPEDELADRADLWLTKQRLDAARNQHYGLHRTPNRPLIVMPVPQPPEEYPITHQEIINTWANSRGGKVTEWAGRLAFIQQWPADQLTGNQSDEPVRFIIMESAYDKTRRGLREPQIVRLRRLQAQYPCISPATIYEGGILAHRYTEQMPTWEDTHVRAIDLAPNKDDCVPNAAIHDKGHADIGESGYGYGGVARLRIG